MNIPEKHRLLFRNTYESLRGRIHSNGCCHVDVLPSYRSKDLEASGGAMNVVSKIFDGKLLFDSEA